MGVFVYVFCHFLIKLFFCLCLTMMLSWCGVTKNIEMSLLFLLFVGAVPLLWILPPIDITLYFNSLGIFDCISRACWSKSMCGHRTADVLWCTASRNYWTDNMSTAITNKQRREISHLEYVFISRQVRGNHFKRVLFANQNRENILNE